MSAASLFPTFRKLGQTPITDLIRGEISGRLDWKSRLVNSGLPEQVCHLISGIVLKAKLWRAEKNSVTDELISHFQDAFEHGVAFEQICAEFGDPMVAAQLIHRSKKRNRSMISKVVKVSGMVGVGVAIAFSLFFAYFCVAQTNVTEDFLPVFNAAVDAPEDDKAWPLYREAWIENQFVNMSIGDLMDEDSRLVSPGSDGWPAAVTWLESKQDLLTAFRLGAKKPVFGLELRYGVADYSPEDQQSLFPGVDPDSVEVGDVPQLDKMVVSINLPHLQAFRNGSRMLCVDSMVAAEQGDGARVIENVETILGMAQHMSENRTVVGSLLGWACSDMAFLTVGKIVADYPDLFGDEELQQVQEMVAAFDLRSLLSLEGERAMTYDTLQNLFSDDGEGDGMLTLTGARTLSAVMALNGAGDSNPSSVESALATFLMFGAGSSRKSVREAFDQIMEKSEARLQKPLVEMLDAASESTYEEVVGENFSIDLILGAITFEDSYLCHSLGKSMGIQAGIELGVAIHRHQREHDFLPESLNELVPAYISQIPQDGLTGEPVNYSVNGDEFTLYWAGVDRDDDGGVLPADISTKNYGLGLHPTTDGDWVLWPVID